MSCSTNRVSYRYKNTLSNLSLQMKTVLPVIDSLAKIQDKAAVTNQPCNGMTPLEYFRMLKAKRKRSSEKQQSMGIDVLSEDEDEDMHCSSSQPQKVVRKATSKRSANNMEGIDHSYKSKQQTNYYTEGENTQTQSIAEMTIEAARSPTIGPPAQKPACKTGGEYNGDENDKEPDAVPRSIGRSKKIAKKRHDKEPEAVPRIGRSKKLAKKREQSNMKRVWWNHDEEMDEPISKKTAKKREQRNIKRVRYNHDEEMDEDESYIESCAEEDGKSDESSSESEGTGKSNIKSHTEKTADTICNDRRVKNGKLSTFDERLAELTEFKNEVGHCNVPKRYAENPTLGNWCSALRTSYNKLQKGQKPCIHLSKDNIDRLKKLGFKLNVAAPKAGFDKHCVELMKFKKDFGHCNVPQKFTANPALGYWCKDLRYSYTLLKKGQPTLKDLSGDRIERLEKIGFKWIVFSRTNAFEKHFDELVEFKNKFGHCNVPRGHAVNPALASWCDSLRYSYNQLQKGQKPRMSLSGDRIQRLEEIGMMWKVGCASVTRALMK